MHGLSSTISPKSSIHKPAPCTIRDSPQNELPNNFTIILYNFTVFLMCLKIFTHYFYKSPEFLRLLKSLSQTACMRKTFWLPIKKKNVSPFCPNSSKPTVKFHRRVAETIAPAYISVTLRVISTEYRAVRIIVAGQFYRMCDVHEIHPASTFAMNILPKWSSAVLKYFHVVVS